LQYLAGKSLAGQLRHVIASRCRIESATKTTSLHKQASAADRATSRPQNRLISNWLGPIFLELTNDLGNTAHSRASGRVKLLRLLAADKLLASSARVLNLCCLKALDKLYQ
jgi:hypothetical protein